VQFSEEDEFHSATAKTVEEAAKPIEEGLTTSAISML
jgi:hypothetical protein